ncbi:MAG: spore cortex-lytic enzyme [Firmicutes bacterium]|nr:spore cortex-lytic enzyme [Bacillota bacterium]
MSKNNTPWRFLPLFLCLCLLTAATAEAETLYWGSRGDMVKTVQQKLKNWGYYTDTADGVFGQSTYNAVIAFQKKNGLTADGVVGKATFAALGISTASASDGSPPGATTASSSNSSDLELLARCVYGEARGEPYIGKVAVAAVVLNRVRSPSFPSTIAGVIYQAGAFTAVSDGQFYLTPDADAYRAARDALNGWDPTYGCLYYYNPSKVVSQWIWSREVRLRIGKHAFAV